MPLSRRYSPEHEIYDVCVYGYDFSPIIPAGEGITAVQLFFFTNVVDSQVADVDWTVLEGPTSIGRTAYAKISGGRAGVDYQLQWTVFTTAGNVWSRVGLLLVGLTS